jgi:hypothetical protein
MKALSKLNPENNQEVFDFVIEKLYRQGKQSKNFNDEGGSQCVYRSDDGSKCAVGHLIPYDLYTSRIESIGAYTLANMDTENKKLKKISDYIKKFNTDLLVRLQTLHDIDFKNIPDFLAAAETISFPVNKDIVHKLRIEYNDRKL